MVSKATRRTILILDSLNPITQPLKTFLLFVGAGLMFLWVAEYCLGSHMPKVSEIIPPGFVRQVRVWLGV